MSGLTVTLILFAVTPVGTTNQSQATVYRFYIQHSRDAQRNKFLILFYSVLHGTRRQAVTLILFCGMLLLFIKLTFPLHDKGLIQTVIQ